MNYKRVLALALVGILTFVTLTIMDSVVGEAAGNDVAIAQAALNKVGYVVAVDNIDGPRTSRALRHYQRANRLSVTGDVNAATLASLARATAPAVRGTQVQIIPPPPPAPVAASGPCSQYVGALTYLSPGWDVARMQSIAYRESRCRPDVTSNTGCCHGLLQIHQMHIPYLDVCGVESVSDLFDPGKNVCSAAVLYRRAGGMSPWNL